MLRPFLSPYGAVVVLVISAVILYLDYRYAPHSVTQGSRQACHLVSAARIAPCGRQIGFEFCVSPQQDGRGNKLP